MTKSFTRRFFQSFDYFGVQFNFHYKSREKYRSATGGIIMIAFVLLAITYVMINVFSFLRRQNFSIIYYTTRLSKTDEINFRNFSTNYAFGLQCGDDELQKRIYKMFAIDVNHVTMIKKEGVTTKDKMKINLRHCNYSDFFNEFNDTFDSLGLDTFWCPNEQNYTVEGIYSDDRFKYYEISILSGMDTMDNYDDIQHTLLNYECDFNMYFVDVAVDLYDYRNPIKRFMNTKFVALKAEEYVKMNLDFHLQKFDSYENYLFNTHESKYYIGYAFFEQYSIFKGIERYQLQPYEYDRFAKIYLRSALQRNIISRKYMKLTEFAADMSSILSQILLFLFVTVSIINRFYANQSVMKKIFQFKNTKNKQGDAFMNEVKKYRNISKNHTLNSNNNNNNQNKHDSLLNSSESENKTNNNNNNNLNTSSHMTLPVNTNNKSPINNATKAQVMNSTLYNISSETQGILFNNNKHKQIIGNNKSNQNYLSNKRRLTHLLYDNEHIINNSNNNNNNAQQMKLSSQNESQLSKLQFVPKLNSSLTDDYALSNKKYMNITNSKTTNYNFSGSPITNTNNNLYNQKTTPLKPYSKPNLTRNTFHNQINLKKKKSNEIMLKYSIIELLFVFICPCLSWEKLRLKNILLDKARKKLYFQLDILTYLKNMQLLELLNYVMLEKHENLILKILSKPSISLVNRMDIYEQLHMRYNVDITDKEMKEFYSSMNYLSDKTNKTNQELRLYKIASIEMQNLLNEE